MGLTLERTDEMQVKAPLIEVSSVVPSLEP
jgi:hypothetical protein